MKACELCKFNFVIKSKLKPFKEWKSLLSMTSSKLRQKVFIDVLLYMLAIMCNIWTLTSFFEIIVQRIRQSKFDWIYFTVLILSFSSLIGIFCFTFAIIKEFHKIFRKWIKHNRIITVQPISVV